jgi:hypothetical protein
MNINEFNKNYSLKDGKVTNKTKSSKFNNVKVCIDGHIFDSIKEGEFYGAVNESQMNQYIREVFSKQEMAWLEYQKK